MEFCHQVLWPELDVQFVSVTDQVINTLGFFSPPLRQPAVPRTRFPGHSSVQEQVEQIEGCNHTHDVGKRGAHCAVGLATYHGPRSRGWRNSEWMVGSAPAPL